MTAATAHSLLTLEEAAERLGTSVRFLRRLRAERRLPFVKLGKHLRVDSLDLEAFIAAGARTHAEGAAYPQIAVCCTAARLTAVGTAQGRASQK